jgi:hypothetical protein
MEAVLLVEGEGSRIDPAHAEGNEMSVAGP